MCRDPASFPLSADRLRNGSPPSQTAADPTTSCNMAENSEDTNVVEIRTESVESEAIAQLNTLLNSSRSNDQESSFNLRLINLVKSKPHLYDHSSDGYNVTPWRNAAWQEISEVLDSAPESVKTRWKTLRDRYKKEEKKEKITGKPSSWAFQKMLTFVQKTTHKGAGRRNSQNHGTVSPCLSEDEEEEQSPMEQAISMIIEQEIVRNNHATEPSTSSSETANDIELPPPPPTKRSRVSLTDSLLTSFNRPSPRSVWNCVDEEDEMFGRMITARLSKLDNKQKDHAKLSMLKTLYDISSAND